MRYVLISIVVLLCGCQTSELPDLEVSVQSSFIIPLDRVNTIEQLTIFLRKENIFLTDNLAGRGLSKDEITSILPGRAVLNTQFQGIDLGFIRDISIKAIDRLDRQKVKEMYYLTSNRLSEGQRMELFPSLSEMKEILLTEDIDLAVVLNFKNFPRSDVEVVMDYTYQIFTDN